MKNLHSTTILASSGETKLGHTNNKSDIQSDNTKDSVTDTNTTSGKRAYKRVRKLSVKELAVIAGTADMESHLPHAPGVSSLSKDGSVPIRRSTADGDKEDSDNGD